MRRHRARFPELIEKHRPRLEAFALGGMGDSHVAIRVRALLMLSEEMPWRLVARQLGTSQNFIVSARQRFLLLGLHGLHDVAHRSKGGVRVTCPAMDDAA